MTKEESLLLTEHITSAISQGAARVIYTAREIEEARGDYSEKKLRELEERGFYFGDFERFYVTLRLMDTLGLWGRADEKYLRLFFRSCEKMDPAAFLQDPYLNQIHIQECSRENILLKESFYRKGEFFQRKMPPFEEETVVPRLGFFPRLTPFPALYEDKVPWVSVCPSEISSMVPDLQGMYGSVLVLGLGLGYFPFRLSLMPRVKRILVVERDPRIITLFREQILPQFSHGEKLEIVEWDALSYLEEVAAGEFDFLYADIWEGLSDGAAAAERIEAFEKRLYPTQFRYWIKKEIDWYRKEMRKP